MVFIFFCCTFKQESVHYKQYLLRCHSSLSQHCDNELMWRSTLQAACECRHMHSCVHTHVRICTVSLHVSMTIASYIACMCACVGVCVCQVSAGDQLAGASVGRWAYTHLCVALLHQLITQSHTDRQHCSAHNRNILTLTVRWPYGIMASLCQTVRRDSLACVMPTNLLPT